jgi:hypothetical protein
MLVIMHRLNQAFLESIGYFIWDLENYSVNMCLMESIIIESVKEKPVFAGLRSDAEL